jgi:hypothetical protein
MKIIEELHGPFLPRNDEAWKIIGSGDRSANREQNRNERGTVRIRSGSDRVNSAARWDVL